MAKHLQLDIVFEKASESCFKSGKILKEVNIVVTMGVLKEGVHLRV